MQTAMEWYFEEEEKFRRGQTKHLSVGPIQKKALEKEKEQIIDAHIEGQRVFDKYQHTQWTNDQAEHYYNQTYNQNK